MSYFNFTQQSAPSIDLSTQDPGATPQQDDQATYLKRRRETADRIDKLGEELLVDYSRPQAGSGGFRNSPDLNDPLLNHYIATVKADKPNAARVVEQFASGNKALYDDPRFQELAQHVKNFRDLEQSPYAAQDQAALQASQLPTQQAKQAANQQFMVEGARKRDELAAQSKNAVTLKEQQDLEDQAKRYNDQLLETNKQMESAPKTQPPPTMLQNIPYGRVGTFNEMHHDMGGNGDIASDLEKMAHTLAIDPTKLNDPVSYFPLAVQKAVEILGPEAQQKFWSDFTTSQQNRIAEAGKDVANADLEERQAKLALQQRFAELRNTPAVQTKGGTLLFVIMSLLMGPKLASALFLQKRDDRSLGFEIQNLQNQVRDRARDKDRAMQNYYITRRQAASQEAASNRQMTSQTMQNLRMIYHMQAARERMEEKNGQVNQTARNIEKAIRFNAIAWGNVEKENVIGGHDNEINVLKKRHEALVKDWEKSTGMPLPDALKIENLQQQNQ